MSVSSSMSLTIASGGWAWRCSYSTGFDFGIATLRYHVTDRAMR